MCRCLICGSKNVSCYNQPFGPVTADFCYKCFSGLINKKCTECGECLADVILKREQQRIAARDAAQSAPSASNH